MADFHAELIETHPCISSILPHCVQTPRAHGFQHPCTRPFTNPKDVDYLVQFDPGLPGRMEHNLPVEHGVGRPTPSERVAQKLIPDTAGLGDPPGVLVDPPETCVARCLHQGLRVRIRPDCDYAQGPERMDGTIPCFGKGPDSQASLPDCFIDQRLVRTVAELIIVRAVRGPAEWPGVDEQQPPPSPQQSASRRSGDAHE